MHDMHVRVFAGARGGGYGSHKAAGQAGGRAQGRAEGHRGWFRNCAQCGGAAAGLRGGASAQTEARTAGVHILLTSPSDFNEQYCIPEQH